MLRPYFEVNNTIKGVFGLATRLYGLHFTKNPKIPVYHPEVEAFEVTDNDGNYVGVIYTDFFPRGRETSRSLDDRVQRTMERRKRKRQSSACNDCHENFSRPTSDTPALLTYDEVETFLHEFGTCSARITFRRHLRFAFRDKRISRFVELPSQFNETIFPKKNFSTALQSTTKPVKKFRSNW